MNLNLLFVINSEIKKIDKKPKNKQNIKKK